jgi:hypothetical protein
MHPAPEVDRVYADEALRRWAERRTLLGWVLISQRGLDLAGPTLQRPAA